MSMRPNHWNRLKVVATPPALCMDVTLPGGGTLLYCIILPRIALGCYFFRDNCFVDCVHSVQSWSLYPNIYFTSRLVSRLVCVVLLINGYNQLSGNGYEVMYGRDRLAGTVARGLHRPQVPTPQDEIQQCKGPCCLSRNIRNSSWILIQGRVGRRPEIVSHRSIRMEVRQ
jgi:hypothetical protein